MGVDSTGILVGMKQRGERPDLVIFSDVGDEREGTYAYLAIINEWLARVGFPLVTVVKYQPKDYKWWPPYHTLFENCMTNITLPSLAYGGHSCSSKWKIQAQRTYLKTWRPAQDAWANGVQIVKCIGFEDTPKERLRTKRCATFAVQDEDPELTTIRFPLQEWGWDRECCIVEIEKEGIPAPPKSSCHFCPAMKPWEVKELSEQQLCRTIIMEARTAKRHLEHAEEKGWPRGVGVPLIEGLWRRRVIGMRGATPKPGSMTQYIKEQGLLPADMVDRLVALTPTHQLNAGDITNWTDWVNDLIERARSPI